MCATDVNHNHGIVNNLNMKLFLSCFQNILAHAKMDYHDFGYC